MSCERLLEELSLSHIEIRTIPRSNIITGQRQPSQEQLRQLRRLTRRCPRHRSAFLRKAQALLRQRPNAWRDEAAEALRRHLVTRRCWGTWWVGDPVEGDVNHLVTCGILGGGVEPHLVMMVLARFCWRRDPHLCPRTLPNTFDRAGVETTSQSCA